MKKSKTRILCTMLLTIFGLQSIVAQTVYVSGTVTDSTGEPLIGVSITIKNGAGGTTTNIDGEYSISVNTDATLNYSYVGYLTHQEKVNGRTKIDVVLQENSELLDEIVVIGYGTMDKKEVTAAVSHISEKDFLSVSSVDPSMMIQGKVPGVSITNTGAGDPQ